MRYLSNAIVTSAFVGMSVSFKNPLLVLCTLFFWQTEPKKEDK